jgi:hypothetical protein
MNRRQWIAMQAGVLGAAGQTPGAQTGASPQTAGSGGTALPLEQYEPKSMLHVPETKVPRARFPVIDFHTHITSARGKLRLNLQPEECLAVMDRKNLRTMVSLTGGYGEALREAVAKLQDAHRGRFVVFTEPAYDRVSQPDYAKAQGDLIGESHKAGAKGLKVVKTLGLYLRDSQGKLVRIDDPRFDPDVGGGGSVEDAGSDPYLRSRSILPAHRSV